MKKLNFSVLGQQLLASIFITAAVSSVAMAQSIGPLAGEDGDVAENPVRFGDEPVGSSSITQSLSNAIVQFNSVACQAGGITTENQYLRRFLLTPDHGINTPFAVSSVDFGIELFQPGAPGPCAGNPINVNIYSIPTGAPLTYANMTLVETASADLVGAPPLSIANIPTPDAGSVDPSSDDLVVEIATCDHNGTGSGGREFIGSNPNGQTGPSFIAASACGIPNPIDLAAIGFPGMHVVMTVFGELGAAEPRATFAVNKDFDDNNPASVEVTISCNTGLPLQQTTTIEEGDGVVFVVVDYESGAMDCTITETVPAGYTANYFDGSVNSATSCEIAGVVHGGAYSCGITNTLDQVEVEVTKQWIDENPQFNSINIADAFWSCSNVSPVCPDGFLDPCTSGNLEFFGDLDTQSFFVYPDWNGGTTCSITEVLLPDGGVETDDGDCQGLVLFPGQGASCTIVNTRLYEGIPTLSQYGLAILALLMLGVGFVAVRRFV